MLEIFNDENVQSLRNGPSGQGVVAFVTKRYGKMEGEEGV